MITEIAQIEVKPGLEGEFEAGVRKAREHFAKAKGFHGMGLWHSIEKPQRYRLLVQWGTLENHTVDFYGSDNWKAWRALVGHCFAAPPEVEHVNAVVPVA
jgi:heme-degrading monooxygenase HmoA